MSLIKRKYNEFKEQFNEEERLILYTCFSAFLPYVITVCMVLYSTFVITRKKQWKSVLSSIPKIKWLYAFLLLSCVMSLAYGNWVGFGLSLGMIVFGLFICYTRTRFTKEMLEYMIDICCILSFIAIFYTCFEYIQILKSLGYDHFVLVIKNRPEYRIHSFFYNANYYATMIEFLIVMCIYKLLNVRRKKVFFYLFTIGLNGFILYMTGCRTALPAVACTVPVMVLVNRNYKIFGGFCGLGVAGIVAVILKPTLIPRVYNIQKYFGVRTKIWKTAFANIRLHPLWGEGPMTYIRIWEMHNGRKANHSHSVYVDPLLCFGIIPLCIIAVFVFDNLKEIYALWKSKKDNSLVALIMGCITVLLIHGVLDHTVFWIQTGLLFMILFNTYSIYSNYNINQK